MIECGLGGGLCGRPRSVCEEGSLGPSSLFARPSVPSPRIRVGLQGYVAYEQGQSSHQGASYRYPDRRASESM